MPLTLRVSFQPGMGKTDAVKFSYSTYIVLYFAKSIK